MPTGVRSSPTNTQNGVALVSLLLTLTYFTFCSSVSIVNFEQVNADWDNVQITFLIGSTNLFTRNHPTL